MSLLPIYSHLVTSNHCCSVNNFTSLVTLNIALVISWTQMKVRSRTDTRSFQKLWFPSLTSKSDYARGWPNCLMLELLGHRYWESHWRKVRGQSFTRTRANLHFRSSNSHCFVRILQICSFWFPQSSRKALWKLVQSRESCTTKYQATRSLASCSPSSQT